MQNVTRRCSGLYSLPVSFFTGVPWGERLQAMGQSILDWSQALRAHGQLVDPQRLRAGAVPVTPRLGHDRASDGWCALVSCSSVGPTPASGAAASAGGASTASHPV